MNLDLNERQQHLYTPLGLQVSQWVAEPESTDYGAYSFKLNHLSVQFRVAKITPTKIGQFVTLWKRCQNGSIQPYDSTDLVDFCIINTRQEAHDGQFIFPKSILCQQNIFSNNGEGGKRAIRVYPPWDIAVNKQAKKTQQWQLEYFLTIPQNGEIDLDRAKLLYEH